MAKHYRSSPTPILAFINQLAKAIIAISHQLILLDGEIKALREANETLLKRRRAKRTRLQDSGPLSGEEARQLLAEKGVVEQERRDEGSGEGLAKRRKTSARLYSICRNTGYNARTCPEAEDISIASDCILVK